MFRERLGAAASIVEPLKWFLRDDNQGETVKQVDCGPGAPGGAASIVEPLKWFLREDNQGLSTPRAAERLQREVLVRSGMIAQAPLQPKIRLKKRRRALTKS